jgi:branched-subunit amino acid ABC-type transport system permease component
MLDWIQLTVPPAPAMFAQVLVGLINGAFYAMLSLGLAIIFGLLNIINFAHGAQYMLGALRVVSAERIGTWLLWPALILAPIIVGALGIAIERHLLRHIYGLVFGRLPGRVLAERVRRLAASAGPVSFSRAPLI